MTMLRKPTTNELTHLKTVTECLGPGEADQDLESLLLVNEAFLDPYGGSYAEAHRRLREATEILRSRANDRSQPPPS